MPVNKPSQENLAVFRPIAAPRRLATELVARLTGDITSGKLPPGARLPTEQELIAATGVSRTVIREAVAALRADGLVVSRQGAGTFVADCVRRPFRVDFDASSTLREVLNVLELRTAIEVEAAGLAAARASPAQIEKIADCFAVVQKAIDRGDNAVEEDFQFHCAVADAARNPQFKRFLEYLGRFIIPRHTVWQSSAPASIGSQLSIFQHEHEKILRAITKHAQADARAAMQRHLRNSRARYEKLAAESGKSRSGARSTLE